MNTTTFSKVSGNNAKASILVCDFVELEKKGQWC